MAFALATLASAQDIPTELWLSYQHQQRLSERVRFTGELGYKELTSTERFFGDWTRLYLTAAASSEPRSWVRLGGGLGLYQTFLPEAEDLSELRLWQEAGFFWPERSRGRRRFVLGHRIRLEERFLNGEENEFEWRLRYRLGTRLPLNTHDIEPGTFFLPVSIELFADLGSESSEPFADRRRASIGLGYVFGPAWILELHYRNQHVRVTPNEDFQTDNHVIDISVRLARVTRPDHGDSLAFRDFEIGYAERERAFRVAEEQVGDLDHVAKGWSAGRSSSSPRRQPR